MTVLLIKQIFLMSADLYSSGKCSFYSSFMKMSKYYNLPDFDPNVLNKGLFTWREEDPRRRIILAPYVFCIQFTCKMLYLALALGSSQLRDMKILAPCKLPSLGRP